MGRVSSGSADALVTVNRQSQSIGHFLIGVAPIGLNLLKAPGAGLAVILRKRRYIQGRYEFALAGHLVVRVASFTIALFQFSLLVGVEQDIGALAGNIELTAVQTAHQRQ